MEGQIRGDGAQKDTLSLPWEVYYPGFPASKLQAGQFSFWFPLLRASGMTAATASCSPYSRPDAQRSGWMEEREVDAGVRCGTDRGTPAPAAAVLHVACSGLLGNTNQNHKRIRRSARRHKTHQSGSRSVFSPAFLVYRFFAVLRCYFLGPVAWLLQSFTVVFKTADEGSSCGLTACRLVTDNWTFGS